MSRPQFDVSTSVPVVSYVDLCCDHVSLTLQQILFHDFSSMSRPGCIVLYCILCRDLRSMSQPHFCHQPLILGHSSPSHVATQNCLSFHCLVATWDLGRDLIVYFLSEIYVATLKVCRDINSFHPISTSLLSHNILTIRLILIVATCIPGRDQDWCLQLISLSQPEIA